MEKKQEEVIDIIEAIKILWKQKKRIIINCSIAFVLSCLWIFPQPRTYTSEVTLAPETESINGGGLSSLASSFGINVGMGNATDAIYPMIYPDLLDSSPFIVGLFDIPVTTIDGEIKTDYYTYLREHQSYNPYTWPLRFLKKQIKSLLSSKEKDDADKKADPFRLTEDQTKIVESIRSKISVVYNNTNEIVSIEVTDQDPLICATMADSVRVRLQDFITEYRTGKAKNDYEYYRQLTENAKKEYEQSLSNYSSYADAHADAIWVDVQSRKDKLNKEQQKKYETYTMLSAQMEAAMAKVRERTPAFTVLQCASVPVKASGPKRMIFVFVMLMLTGIATSVYIIKKENKNIIKVKL